MGRRMNRKSRRHTGKEEVVAHKTGGLYGAEGGCARWFLCPRLRRGCFSTKCNNSNFFALQRAMFAKMQEKGNRWAERE